MITGYRFILLILVMLYACAFVTTFVYGVHHAFYNHFKGDFYIPELFIKYAPYCAFGVIGLVIISATPISEMLLRLSLPIRKLSLREEQKVNPVIEHIKEVYQEQYGLRLKVKTFMVDNPDINGFAVGLKTIAISTGLLKVAGEEEMASILAHEVGHIHHRDTLLTIAILAALWPISILQDKIGGFWKYFLMENIIFTPIVFLVFAYFFPFFAVFLVLSYPFTWLLGLSETFTQWPKEYRADRFAAKLGFGEALIRLFESIEDRDIRTQEGFMVKYFVSHPPTALRIDRLERAMLK